MIWSRAPSPVTTSMPPRPRKASASPASLPPMIGRAARASSSPTMRRLPNGRESPSNGRRRSGEHEAHDRRRYRCGQPPIATEATLALGECAASAPATTSMPSVPVPASCSAASRSRMSRGLVGHSDADVALHALTDAVLGALAEGDIGRSFPALRSASGEARHRTLSCASRSAALRGTGRTHRPSRRRDHRRGAEHRAPTATRCATRIAAICGIEKIGSASRRPPTRALARSAAARASRRSRPQRFGCLSDERG